MGAGYSQPAIGRAVYAEPYDGLPEYDESIGHQWREAWQDMESEIIAALSPKWHDAGRNMWRDRRARILAQSALHDLTLEEDSGGYGYAYISVLPRADLDSNIEALAVGNVDTVAESIFRKLAAVMPLRVPHGWTSSPYAVAA